MKGYVTHYIVDQPAAPRAHVARRIPFLGFVTWIIQHLVTEDANIPHNARLHLFESILSQSFRSDTTFERMLFVVDGCHYHLSFEEMAEHSEELAFLTVCAHMIDVAQGRVRVHRYAMWSISYDRAYICKFVGF